MCDPHHATLGDPNRPHIPVLCEAVLAALAPRPGMNFVDATVGAGGHAAALLEHTAPEGRLLAVDADPDALALAARRLSCYGARVTLVHSNFAALDSVAARAGFRAVGGILFDLGVSSMQFDRAARGFSFQQDAPLDMRMDPDSPTTAADLVNSLSLGRLTSLIGEYGEEPRARSVARAILAARERGPITTTRQLVAVVTPAAARTERIHPATRTFQALRIATNAELERLAVALPKAVDLLAPRGRLAVISFHSLEDRIVKQFIAAEERGCVCPPKLPVCTCGRSPRLRKLFKKPIVASPAEVARNARSRSAKLRVAERIGDGD